MPSIPISSLVGVYPRVISTGGSAIDFCALALTGSNDVPLDQPIKMTSAASVGQFFGMSSDEYLFAQMYFSGYVNATKRPAFLLFGAYSSAARASWARGASRNFSLSALQGLTGELTVTVNGAAETSGQITLAAASSFSNAAEIIQAGFTSPNFTIAYNGTLQAFIITSNVAGSSEQITAVGGSLASALGFDGATFSRGTDGDNVAYCLDQITANIRDFVTIVPVFRMSDDDMSAMAVWNNGQNSRWICIAWGSPPDAILANDTTSIFARIANYDGIVRIWTSDLQKAAFEAGYLASVSYGEAGGRTIAAWRHNDGLTADVTNGRVAQILEAAGINFYGQYAEANTQFNIFYPGAITGRYLWIDSYANQIYLNITLQATLANLMLNSNRLPVNADGFNAIASAMQPVLKDAVASGTITTGITMTSDEAAQVQAITGSDMSDTIYSSGYVVYIAPATAEQRAARGRFQAFLFYADGEAIQTMDLTSALIQ